MWPGKGRYERALHRQQAKAKKDALQLIEYDEGTQGYSESAYPWLSHRNLYPGTRETRTRSFTQEDEHVESFESYRTYLFAIAYRMLGSAMDAQDMVQETYLRFQTTPETITLT